MNSSTLQLYYNWQKLNSCLQYLDRRMTNEIYLNKNLLRIAGYRKRVIYFGHFFISFTICMRMYLFIRMHGASTVPWFPFYARETWKFVSPGGDEETTRNSVFNSVNSVSSSSIRVFRLCTRSLNSRASTCMYVHSPAWLRHLCVAPKASGSRRYRLLRRIDSPESPCSHDDLSSDDFAPFRSLATPEFSLSLPLPRRFASLTSQIIRSDFRLAGSSSLNHPKLAYVE